jgi:glycosyltransferase involved in cell wall biosynthesis
MKIDYVTFYPVDDLRSWSGTIKFLKEMIHDQNIKMNEYGSLRTRNLIYNKIKRRVYKLFDIKYNFNLNTKVLKSYARQIEKKIKHSDSDIIFSPGIFTVAHLETSKPIVIYTDAPLAGLINYYDTYHNMAKESIEEGHYNEQLALSKADLIIYSSQWAKNVAVDHYDVDPKKIKVLPFGANLETEHKKEDIEKYISSRSQEVCKILFIGKEWDRKGGEDVLQTAKELNKRGLKTEVSMVGYEPNGINNFPSFIKMHGFVDKNTQEGLATMNRLFAESHFMFVPSRAEAYGIVFCEASSYGIPSISTSTGGIDEVIRNGKNGMKFPINTSAEEYADYIEKTFTDQKTYKNLAFSSFKEYQTRLNWSTTGKKFKELLENLKE